VKLPKELEVISDLSGCVEGFERGCTFGGCVLVALHKRRHYFPTVVAFKTTVNFFFA